MLSRDSMAVLLLLLRAPGCESGKAPLPAESVPRPVPAALEETSGRPPRPHPSGTAITSVPVAGRPFGVALSPEGTVYCTLLDAASLASTRLQPDSIRTIPVGDTPTDIAFAPGGSWAYVTNQRSRSIGIVDARSDKQVAEIPVDGDPFRVAAGPEGQVIYATTNVGNLVQLNPEKRSVSWSMRLGGNLNGLTTRPDGARVYVGDVGEGRVYEVEPDGEVVRSFSVPGRPQGLALSSDGRELYIAGEAGDLIVLDLETGTESARVRLGVAGFGIAVTPDQAQIWVSSASGGQVVVVDRVSRAIVRRLELGGTPRRIAFDRSGSRAVIADEAGTIRFVR